MNDKVKISHEDALIDIVCLIDSIEYIMQDVHLEYFEKFNSKKDQINICREFERNRARTNAIWELIRRVKHTLDKANIER